MVGKLFRIIFVCFLFVFSSCRNNVKLPHPISELQIGMDKNEALSNVKTLMSSKIMDSENFVLFDSIKVKIELKFCADCTGEVLEGVLMKSENSKKVFELLSKVEYSSKLNVEMLPVLESLYKSNYLDTVVCMFSDKLKYDEVYKNIVCVRNREDPCW
ncbi:MAG: hypothetical protein ACI86M_002893 [Saprospiraceae bacterium]|jgi:hypothetical protein